MIHAEWYQEVKMGNQISVALDLESGVVVGGCACTLNIGLNLHEELGTKFDTFQLL